MWLFTPVKKIEHATMAAVRLIPIWRSLAAHRQLYSRDGIRDGRCSSRANGESMEWARLLARITETIDQELLLPQ
jgi:hypothetical protein